MSKLDTFGADYTRYAETSGRVVRGIGRGRVRVAALAAVYPRR